MKPITDDALAAEGVEIKHHFADGVYIKEAHVLAAGKDLKKHTHDYTHFSILVSGAARVTIGGIEHIYNGFHILKIEKGVPHSVQAITDIIWLCVHATDDTNPNTVDISLMSKIVKE